MSDGMAYTRFCVGFDRDSLLDDWEPCFFSLLLLGNWPECQPSCTRTPLLSQV